MRRWNRESDDDPLAGMVNLFDLWIVVVVGLILALLGAMSSRDAALRTATAAHSASESEAISAEFKKLPRYRKSDAALSGRGERLGTAYRLESGEVVYIPFDSPLSQSDNGRSPAQP